MSKDTVEPERPTTTLWRMRISCWLRNVTDINAEYVLLIAFQRQNGCTNAPQYYVVRTLRVLLISINVLTPLFA